MKTKYLTTIAAALALATSMAALPAFADTPTTTNTAATRERGRGPMMGEHVSAAFGTVTALSGNTITITSKAWRQNTTVTTYTIDATNATISKNGGTVTLADVAVGDTIMAEGTANGTTITATVIRDGMPTRGERPEQGQKNGQMQNIPQGNGQPIIGGTISSISGTTLTLTNKSNVTYTIDAANAKVTKNSAPENPSSVAVGDNVIVQGTVNGNTVTASSVIDRGAPKTQVTEGTTGTEINQPHKGFVGDILGGIGGFFGHLFGF